MSKLNINGFEFPSHLQAQCAIANICQEAVEAGVRLYKAGQSDAKRAAKELEDIIVWAKLIRVNDSQPENTINGFIRVNISQAKNIAVNLVENMSVKTRKTWDGIKITIKRLR